MRVQGRWAFAVLVLVCAPLLAQQASKPKPPPDDSNISGRKYLGKFTKVDFDKDEVLVQLDGQKSRIDAARAVVVMDTYDTVDSLFKLQKAATSLLVIGKEGNSTDVNDAEGKSLKGRALIANVIMDIGPETMFGGSEKARKRKWDIYTDDIACPQSKVAGKTMRIGTFERGDKNGIVIRDPKTVYNVMLKNEKMPIVRLLRSGCHLLHEDTPFIAYGDFGPCEFQVPGKDQPVKTTAFQPFVLRAITNDERIKDLYADILGAQFPLKIVYIDLVKWQKEEAERQKKKEEEDRNKKDPKVVKDNLGDVGDDGKDKGKDKPKKPTKDNLDE